MKLRYVLTVLLAVLLAASSLVIAPPEADAITSRDQQRLDNASEVIAALEGWAAVDGDFVIDGAGLDGEGRSWFQVDTETSGFNGVRYPKSIATALIEAGFLREGQIPTDPSDTRLGRHSIYDFRIYQCMDRVGVWIRTKYEETPSADLQWWTSNDCPMSSLHDYVMISAPLSELVPHDEVRVGEVDRLVAALESYASVNGTYVVDNAGYKDAGWGWYFYQGTSSYHNYDQSIANALIADGHLNPGDVPLDPQVRTAQKHFNAFDLRVYPCAGRAAVVAYTQGTIFTSAEDRAWWEANYEDTTNNTHWRTENKCPTRVADPDNRIYLKLTEPLENVYQAPEDEADDGGPLPLGEFEVCAVLQEGVPIIDPGGFIRGETENPRPDVNVIRTVGGTAESHSGEPDQELPTAYLWVPDGYYHTGQGEINAPWDNYAAGVGPFTLMHYFGRDEETTWVFDTTPTAWVSDWRTTNHPTGRFRPIAGTISDVVNGEIDWTVTTDIVPAVSYAEPAPVPCVFRVNYPQAFWSPSVYNLGADLALDISDAVDQIFTDIADLALLVASAVFPIGCLGLLNGDSGGELDSCIAEAVEYLPFYDCYAALTGSADALTVAGCAADALPAGSVLVKTVFPNGPSRMAIKKIDVGEFDSAGRRLDIVGADGTKHFSVGDGSTFSVKIDGTTITRKVDGTHIRQNPDGSSVTTEPDGATITKHPDGSTTSGGPDGSVEGTHYDDRDFVQNSEACSIASFPGETLVLLADGSYHRIDQIRPGDDVVSFNFESGRWENKVVVDQWSYDDDGASAQVKFGDGSAITATDDHLFWNVTTQKWSEIQQLRSGAELLSPDGIVEAIEVMVHPARPWMVWELTVAENHNFVVSSGSVDALVHNARRCGDPDDQAEVEANIDAVADEHRPPGSVDPKALKVEPRVGTKKPGQPQRGQPWNTEQGWKNAPNIKNFRSKGGEVFEATDGGLVYELDGVAVHYNADGFPDFTPHAKVELTIIAKFKPGPNGSLVADRAADFSSANELAGLPYGTSSPPGYTWHHVETAGEPCCQMQLVPHDIHKNFPHRGGISTSNADPGA